MLKKEKIKLNNRDVNIKISLGNSNNFTGYQQEINKLTNFNTNDVVNEINDVEVRRFKFFSNGLYKLQFKFHIPELNDYDSSLTEIGFEENEINYNNPAIQNSFFIMNCYDTFNKYSQEKIFSNYNSKIISNETNGIYNINNKSQFFNLNVPIWFIESITGDSVVLYMRFSLYNAKNGNVISFYNEKNVNLLTDEKYYVKTELNLNNFTWRFLPDFFQYMIILKEIERNKNENFNEKLNNTVNNTVNRRIIPPTGDRFNDETGTYVTT